MLLFNAAPISLRSFASTVDFGLVPEGERKASGLLARNPSEGCLVVDFGDVFRSLLLSRQRLLIMKHVRKA